MEITGHSVETLKDPFGLLEGDRYEFFLQIEVDEDDEVYNENGLLLRVIYSAADGESRIIQYYFIEKTTEKVLDFALEEDEEGIVRAYCQNNLSAMNNDDAQQ